MANQISLTGGGTQNLAGVIVPNGTIQFALSTDAVTIATNAQVLAGIPYRFPLNSSGNISGTAKIWSNAELSPSGTYYLVNFYDVSGNRVNLNPYIWIFNQAGGSTVDIGTIVPGTPSSPTYPGAVVLSPVGDQVIVQPSNTNLRVNRFEQIRFANEFSGADGGAKINAADADLGSNPGEIWVTQDIGTSWTTAVTISAKHVLRFIQGGTYTSSASPMITLAGSGGAGNGAAIVGTGTATILQTSSGTADVIQMTGNVNYAANLLLRSSVTRTAGAGINCKGGGCSAENIEINLTWNGVQCNFSGGAGIVCNNLILRQGGASAGAWNVGIQLGGQTSGSATADCFFHNCQVSDAGSFPFADAACVVDAGVDNARFVSCDFSGANAGSICFKSKFSGGSMDVPRMVRFTSCAFETGTTVNCIEVTAYKDLEFLSCVVNTGIAGLYVNGSTNGTMLNFLGGSISQCQQQNIRIDSGSHTYISHAQLSGASQQTNATYDSILVAANVNNFGIVDCNFSDQFGFTNHPNFNIKVTAGTSDNYKIVDNTAGASVVSGLLSDGGTGSNKTIGPNFPVTNKTFIKSTLNVPVLEGPGFQLQKFTSNGTWTIPTGVIQAKATVVAAGGAGGGASAVSLGTGGGSGSVGIKYLTGLTPGNTIAVTVGTGGTGVSGGNGNAGGNSSIASGTQTITTVTANGGGGGINTGNDVGGAPGAISTNGDINLTGTPGEAPATANTFGGNGGATPIFGGGALGAAGSTAGGAGVNPGSGGSGAGLGANNAGGAGANGIVIFEWVS